MQGRGPDPDGWVRKLGAMNVQGGSANHIGAACAAEAELIGDALRERPSLATFATRTAEVEPASALA